MSGAMVRISGLGINYGSFAAVRGLDLELGRGKILALLGPSGCGKTTTLRAIAGFEPPSEGEIEIDGEKVVGESVFVPPEKRRVGVVFQDYALFPHLTVERNIAFGLSGDKKGNRVSEIISLARLDGLGSRMPHELSGGQQQRVALARALAPEPSVILLDEPFSNLDAALRAEVRRDMKRILIDAGATSIFVTHDQDEALSLADEVAVMLDGRIVQSAPPEELYHSPATKEIASFVGDANFLSGVSENGSARCALGEIPVGTSPSGEVEVMVRPESLRLENDDHGEARILDREFYGHDQLVRLALDSKEEMIARLGSGHTFDAGDRVSVRITGEAVAFPIKTADSALE
ncbi:MAG: ABC transporter ATP-binding protein [Actinomycetota bacterium]|jgi:iron(III) transport system ATP-binding protein|nr:ABC transporter ATP-binding protein [Rubrobacter sp.]MDQ3507257.1 ABC transporter ATP-binding protein [Actinomycetota bacterium]